MLNALKKILKKLNPLSQCRKYGIPPLQCPQFLFLIMGSIIIGAILATYSIAAYRIKDPKSVVLIVIGVTLILLIISYIITRSFERIAEASRMKTEFIGIVSHQLRSPLTNLKYSLEILTNTKLKRTKEEEKEYFSILKENVKRMQDLINNLLIVSRIEMGKIPLKKEKVSLEKIAKKIALKFKSFAEASNVKIILNIEKNLPTISTDPLWLEQIIENLLDNAIRYIKEKGEVRIKIRQLKNKIYFEIQDTGVGIPKEEQKYIFQKFFRSKNALKYQTEGSGLGLHIVKKILELMHGKIWFKSKENEGTTFYFTLPINKE